MSNLRTSQVPADYLTAEMAAFPLASEAGLLGCVTSLDTSLSGQTGELWRAAESLLIQHGQVSIDELVALRDLIWFQNSGSHAESESVPLHRLVKRIARSYLRHRGSEAAPCLDPAMHGEPFDAQTTKPRAREAWRWMSFSLSPDFLLPCLDERQIPSRVEQVSGPLKRELARHGLAEVHLHLGAATGFRVLWVWILHRVASYEFEEDALVSPGAALNEGRDLAGWLIRAAIVRYVLACYLAEEPTRLSFVTWYSSVAEKRIARRLGDRAGRQLSRVLVQMSQPQPDLRFQQPPSFRELQFLYRQLTGIQPDALFRETSRSPTSQNPAALRRIVLEADPIASMWPSSGLDGPTPDMRFTFTGLRHLDFLDRASVVEPGRFDQTFAALFWQTVRVRNLIFRHLVQRPLTPGLQWFTRTYDRAWPLTGELPVPLRVVSAALHSGFGHGLRSLEIRTSPRESQSENRQFLIQSAWAFQRLLDFNRFAKVASREEYELPNQVLRRLASRPRWRGAAPEAPGSKVEFGVVFHLVRYRGGKGSAGLPAANNRNTFSEPVRIIQRDGRSDLASEYRHGTLYRRLWRQTQSVSEMLRAEPELLTILRGIDACTDELGVPTWVIAPLFRILKDTSIRIAGRLQQRPGIKVPPLSTTIHCGEDYVHLASGLRRIHEAIEHLGLREADRLGHAVALGANATRWAESAGTVAISREEWLFNLVWEWNCYRTGLVDAPARRLARISKEIERLADAIFESHKGLPCQQVAQLVRSLYDESILKSLGFLDGRRPARRWWQNQQNLGRHLEIELTWLWLTDSDVFRRSQIVERFNPADEAESLETLQQQLRNRISELKLTVEVNPTSNLLIGNFTDLNQHPLWRLSPPGGSDSSEKAVPIAIGSDDPLQFCTDLPWEYQLVEDSLVLNGVSPVAAADWLRRVRENGLDAAFTLSDSK